MFGPLVKKLAFSDHDRSIFAFAANGPLCYDKFRVFHVRQSLVCLLPLSDTLVMAYSNALAAWAPVYDPVIAEAREKHAPVIRFKTGKDVEGLTGPTKS